MGKFNVMVDLETLSARPNAAIVSIGAVEFNYEGFNEDNPFYEEVDLSYYDETRYFDKNTETIKWWMKQSEEVRESLNGTMHLKSVLQMFSQWVKTNANGRSVRVWGNSSSFDNVILRIAYEHFGMTPPWKWWGDRCYRTVQNMFVQPYEHLGTSHNALDDAASQAAHLVKLCKKYGLKLN